ncbi:hypothetical protein JKP88DRAFT_205771 [Tribonema minus]|uniref:Photosystem II reaction center M protein n=1 Tax=Tribonema minus TaxID=303371 RepID=A0A835ZJC8_9STRA|nr:hypothetical protein JKP88DRAFT_205771 [Tribonema minus]
MAKMFALLLVAFAACVSAFVAPAAPIAAKLAPAMSMSLASSAAKAVAGVAPAALAAPAFADSDIVSQLPTQLMALEVQFGAYLAVLLGTFVPVAFLIVLYIQSESRKAGERSGRE